MMEYKGWTVEEVLNMGNAGRIEKMEESIRSRKSKNRNNEKYVKECNSALKMIEEWKEKNGISKGGKRGKYDGIEELKDLSEGELKGMYESLYSRRSYYKKVGRGDKVEELNKRLEGIKKERRIRRREEMLEEDK